MFRLILVMLSCSIGHSQDSKVEQSLTSQGQNGLSVTVHQANTGAGKLDYTAYAGFLPLYDETGKTLANMFYCAYTHNDNNSVNARPVTFVLNGGPGSSAVWLHLGALGPMRVDLPLNVNADIPIGPLIENSSTWLDFTDLVFIDPVGTGYSRTVSGVDAGQFFKIDGDIRSIANFIRLYCTKHNRWLSPKFFTGESYGAARAAAIGDVLYRANGLKLTGIIMISSAINLSVLSFDKELELPYVLYLPSYTAAAWYHKMLPDFAQMSIQNTLTQASYWANTDYLLALHKGDSLSKDEFDRVSLSLSKFTGLSREYIALSNLRIDAGHFMKELLRGRSRSIGMMDSRVLGIEDSAVSERVFRDQSFYKVKPAFVSAFMSYIRNELNWHIDMPYEYFSYKINESWDWADAKQGYMNVTGDLATFMSANPDFKVFNAAGLFDMTTPYMAQIYTLEHLGLDQSLRSNVTIKLYESGHQMYTSPEILKKLHDDVREFVGTTRSNHR